MIKKKRFVALEPAATPLLFPDWYHGAKKQKIGHVSERKNQHTVLRRCLRNMSTPNATHSDTHLLLDSGPCVLSESSSTLVSVRTLITESAENCLFFLLLQQIYANFSKQRVPTPRVSPCPWKTPSFVTVWVKSMRQAWWYCDRNSIVIFLPMATWGTAGKNRQKTLLRL